MAAEHAGHVGDRPPARRAGWLASAVLSGFAASLVMLLAFSAAYGLALLASGLPAAALPASEFERPLPLFGQLKRVGELPPTEIPGAELVRLWLHNLTHNRAIEAAAVDPFTATGLYLLGGLCWAVVYALLAEPRLSGPGWLRGAKFSLVPGLLSLVVFLPLVGGGPFGLALGAGPLPIIGNLLLHLVYGVTLGQLYGPWGELDATTLEPPGPGADAGMLRAGRMAARGVLAGLAVGMALGVVAPVAVGLAAGTPQPVQPVSALVLLGAVLGAAVGGTIGSFLGLSAPGGPRRTL